MISPSLKHCFILQFSDRPASPRAGGWGGGGRAGGRAVGEGEVHIERLQGGGGSGRLPRTSGRGVGDSGGIFFRLDVDTDAEGEQRLRRRVAWRYIVAGVVVKDKGACCSASSPRALKVACSRQAGETVKRGTLAA